MQSWNWESALLSCAASSSPPPPSLSCMVQYDRQMCENAAQHPAWLGAVQQKWFLGEITVGDVPKRWIAVPLFLSHTRLFLRHQRSWCGTGGTKMGFKLFCVMAHEPFPLFSLTHRSVCHSSSEFSSFFFLQNDDGPDVRAGSGDILLVHATETERKGTVWWHLCSLCVFNRTVS